ncbi:MAG: hypothetical protein JW744_03710 [Candidatus Diapherotrites archaeon]|uniref:Carboxypeptidase regulatory-like domain-containing protein n=1 Tax=Candidatus Iainarchaeum sp. TaxID=3101447 RepID=A0A939C6K5_9ARCH|nr:hypothetical protein [Candidatus Diapherotrites archaeon]
MYGPDKFDEPHYSDEEIDLGGEGFGSQVAEMLGPAKQYLPHIIVAVVAIVAGLLLYDYFIGSYGSVTITLRDTEGEYLDDTSLKLFAEGSAQPLFSESGSSTYTISLKPGRYRYEATSPGYAVKRSSVEIAKGETTSEIELEKDIEVEITGFGSVFPERLYAGQSIELEIRLENKRGETASVQIVPEQNLEDYASETQAVQVPGSGTAAATLTVSVPASASIDDQTEGDLKKAAVRIKYTNERASSEFTLYPNPKEKITLSSPSFSVKAIGGKNKQSRDIRITNSNRFPIENLELSIEITSSTENSKEEAKEWFQFTEVADQPEPWKLDIESIGAGKSVEKELQVIVPLTAEDELGIKGNIVLDAGYFTQPKKEPLTLDITEKASYEIELSLSPRQPYSIEWDSAIGGYEEKIVSLNLKNSGQIELENIVVSVENDETCSTSWLVFLENSLDSLAIGQTRELKVRITAPLFQRGNESPIHCDLHYRYDNPLELGSYVEDTIIAFIEIEPEAD